MDLSEGGIYLLYFLAHRTISTGTIPKSECETRNVLTTKPGIAEVTKDLMKSIKSELCVCSHISDQGPRERVGG